MRYNIKVPTPKPVVVKKEVKIPVVGDTKEVIKFAFLPTKISKTCGVWMERYIEIWEYKKCSKRVYKSGLNYKYNSLFNLYEVYMYEDWKLKEKHLYI